MNHFPRELKLDQALIGAPTMRASPAGRVGSTALPGDLYWRSQFGLTDPAVGAPVAPHHFRPARSCLDSGPRYLSDS
jgi:hypothetical protein